MGRAWSVYTKASQMERETPGGPSKWTLTKAPGIGGLQGRNRGRPSSTTPVNLYRKDKSILSWLHTAQWKTEGSNLQPELVFSTKNLETERRKNVVTNLIL